jgi:hypothetical protein
MFIGSINRYMRAVLETAAGQWKGLPVYVACSGNFTVERILARCGVGAVHSDDVSVYSWALGWHPAGQAVPYKVKQDEFTWLADYLAPGPATIATLLLTGELLKTGSAKNDNAYARRMREEYRRRRPDLHARTVERVTKAVAGFQIACYFAGDCREFLADADRDLFRLVADDPAAHCRPGTSGDQAALNACAPASGLAIGVFPADEFTSVESEVRLLRAVGEYLGRRRIAQDPVLACGARVI